MLPTYMEEYLIPMNDCFSDVFINSLGNRLSFNQLIFIHNPNSIKLNKSHSGLQLFAKEQLHSNKKNAGHDTMHGTDASLFMGPETTTKIAKLLEREIDFFLILPKTEYSYFKPEGNKMEHLRKQTLKLEFSVGFMLGKRLHF